MTIVVSVDTHPLEQVTKQLNKLVNVIKIVELDDITSVQRELVFVKVKANAQMRSDVLEIISLFRARVVDVAADSLIVEITGTRDKIDAMLEVLTPYGILELAQSGMVAVGRGSKRMTDKARLSA